jgi:hypothetical protein
MKSAFNLKKFKLAMSGIYLVQANDFEQVIKECASLRSGLRDLITGWDSGESLAVRNDLTDEVYLIQGDELIRLDYRGRPKTIVPHMSENITYLRDRFEQMF